MTDFTGADERAHKEAPGVREGARGAKLATLVQGKRSSLDAERQADACQIIDIIGELAARPIWLPHTKSKVPHDGRTRLSTAEPSHSMPLLDAVQTAGEHGLAGVGLNLTDGIRKTDEHGDWRLLAVDVDKADFDRFERPFTGYAEYSPSRTGLHCYAWVPEAFAENYQDTVAPAPHCKHVEFYLGTSPRFITTPSITDGSFVYDDSPIPHLTGDALLAIGQQLKRANPTPASVPELPEQGGFPLDLAHFSLTPDQRQLIDGRPGIDRSSVLHGLLIRLLDTGASQPDVLATLIATPALWQVCLDHRHHDADRAMEFARQELARAYANTKKAQRDRLVGLNSGWGEAPEVSKDEAAFSSQPAFIGPDKSHCLELTAEPEKREAIVGDLIYATNGVLIAPGGVGKTTLTIHEAIHLILGRDIWQQKVHRPGGVLFITGEDEREEFLRRLYMLMGALNLTPGERQKVMQNFYVEDVTDRIVRLAELDQSGNIIMTPHVDELIERYKGVNLAMVNIDPLVYFGAGERLVNDAESVMCQVAKRLSRKLNAHVRLIHHTGKEVARNGTHDQYAGRGGSALADNSRLVMQVIDGESKDFRVPEMAKTLLTMGYQALQVHFHKNSYGRKPPFPVWMMREGWRFHEFNGEPVSETANRKERLDKIKRYIVGKLQAGVYLSKSSLVEAYSDIGVSRNQLRTLVNEALQTSELVERDLPPEKVQGRFQQYLDMPMGKDRERFFVGYQVAE